jgi:hypothetical protein
LFLHVGPQFHHGRHVALVEGGENGGVALGGDELGGNLFAQRGKLFAGDAPFLRFERDRSGRGGWSGSRLGGTSSIRPTTSPILTSVSAGILIRTIPAACAATSVETLSVSSVKSRSPART